MRPALPDPLPDDPLPLVAAWLDWDGPGGRHRALLPEAALVSPWAALEQQMRVEGPVTLAPDADTDAYWAGRPADARIAAVASGQSRPSVPRAALLAAG